MTSGLAAAVDLNRPGHYLNWSIFTVSVANLVLIAVMVVIFGVALLLPFPHRKDEETSASPLPGNGATLNGTTEPDKGQLHTHVDVDPADRTWTGALRRGALRVLPPPKLLPGRQPAYVASWIYVFGVATLAALGVAIASGFAIALGGPDWWHTNPVGHFFNSLHLWSVEIFMAFMVIHLWGKFWMAAWRGRRALTWITGVLAFVASVVECFTGYLSQQNFDAQWISTNGKDAINATGLGGFFNLMNFGQMLLWHVVLVPIVLLAIVGAHVLLVRVRGVAHPLPVPRAHGRAARRRAARADAADWTGPTRVYDILKEAVAAIAIVTALVILLAGVLSSPDEPAIAISTWARLAPADFVATATGELAGTTETATYGPPYNTGTGSTQQIGISWEKAAGVRIPVNPAVDFVLNPLAKEAPTNPPLQLALRQYLAAPADARAAWLNAYTKALDHVTFHNGAPVVQPGLYGPVPVMISTELSMARGGSLDADPIANQPFYGTNFTKPLLFMEDGEYFAQQAQAQHLTGSQWGVMNETGSYPGQPWLWLYTLWYQLPGFDNSANVDMIAIYLTGGATILLLALPFVPGLRDIPEVIPLHRVVWRYWNGRDNKAGPSAGPAGPSKHDVLTG
jgi:Cytochrome b(N-terminal)/b6/petB